MHLGDICVTTPYINHNVLTLGYRLNAPDETSIAYYTDHEAFDHTLATQDYKRGEDGEEDNNNKKTDDRHEDYFAGVDLLIHDTQFMASEHSKKYSGVCCRHGHGCWGKEQAPFHHDPQRTDKQVDEMLALARERIQNSKGTPEVIAAADNSSLTVQNCENDKFSGRKSKIAKSTKLGILESLSNSDAIDSERSSAFIEGVSASQQVVISHPDRSRFDGLSRVGWHSGCPH